MCRKKVFFSPFLSSSSSEKRDESGKHEAEKLPDKFETFHDGYTTFLIRLYRLSSRQRDGGEDEMLSLAVFFFSVPLMQPNQCTQSNLVHDGWNENVCNHTTEIKQKYCRRPMFQCSIKSCRVVVNICSVFLSPFM